MGARKKLHFEIQAQVGLNWTFLCIARHEHEATKLAKDHRRKDGYSAVRVMREKFDQASGTFRSSQIFLDGREKRASNIADQDSPISCWRPSDFYSFHGRRTISRLLRGEFDRWKITATELVHCLDYVERLEDTGTVLQRAVQHVAIAEARDGGGDVQGRVKQLYELVAVALDGLRKDWQAGDIPEITASGFPAITGELGRRRNPEYWLNCGLVGYLRDAGSQPEKISRLLVLLDAGLEQWVVDVLDGLIGELITANGVIQRLIGEQPDLGRALVNIADLARGRFLLGAATVDPATPMLNRFFADNRLPNAQAGLAHRLRREVMSNRRLVPENLLAEVETVASLREHLEMTDGRLLGGEEMAEALDRRIASYLNAETLRDYLDKAADSVDEIHMMLSLEPHFNSAANKRTLVNFLLPLLGAPKHVRFLTEENGSVIERMNAIAALQRRVLVSGLQEMHSRRIAEALDEQCVQVIRDNDVFKRFVAIEDSLERAVKLLRLCASGCFTEGSALRAAQTLAQRFLNEKGFLQRYLDADQETDLATRLKTFQRLLEEAGFTDVRAA